MDQIEETAGFRPRGRVLKTGTTYHSPDFSTLSAAKSRKKHAAKRKISPKKSSKERDFCVEELFLTDP